MSETPTIATEPAPALDDDIHDALLALRSKASDWVATGPGQRVRLLERLIADTAAVAERWAAACISAEGLDPLDPSSGEEAMVGPYILIRDLRLLRDAIDDIERYGTPRIAGPVRTRPGRAGHRPGLPGLDVRSAVLPPHHRRRLDGARGRGG